MKHFIRYFLLFTYLFLSPAFAENAPASDNFKQWEQENAGREEAQETQYSKLWNKTLLLLIFVLLVLFVGTWYLKKFGGLQPKQKTGSQRIQLLEKQVISPKAVVYLLSIDGHKVALSETSTGIQVLKEFTTKAPD